MCVEQRLVLRRQLDHNNIENIEELADSLCLPAIDPLNQGACQSPPRECHKARPGKDFCHVVVVVVSEHELCEVLVRVKLARVSLDVRSKVELKSELVLDQEHSRRKTYTHHAADLVLCPLLGIVEINVGEVEAIGKVFLQQVQGLHQVEVLCVFWETRGWLYHEG